MITEKAPGKLYIAGEYAVVENGYPAILVALDQFVTCSIEESEAEVGRIISRQYHKNALQWHRLGEQMVVDNRDNPFSYILSAIKVTEEYARAFARELRIFDLHIDSQLDSESGKKYGLGSSAAVTVATVKALCRFYNLPVTKDEIFKLAAIAHFEVQGNGSLGDVAASVYGGWIAYHSFDRQWLAQQRKYLDLRTLIELPWPDLKIESLKAPSNLQLLIGWTGKPASTSQLVDKISLFKARQQKEYHQFLEESKHCIQRMVDGFHNADLEAIKNEIRYNRELLKQLGINSGVHIETPILNKLCQIAEDFGGAAKTSGAGGGDCGIVAIDRNSNFKQVLTEWTANKIEQLPLSVHFIENIKGEIKHHLIKKNNKY
ncbi:phosphomevalonate kinase [Limosilactobacillus fastidiosus]|uniref:phosphomevalonate kinase n=1 Tax=Limosilactobacillus fastidiosus TaxID=2759855 RepID=A0A7W3YCP7_9LACO|nr:phosphomevalonate kinase [Limosilactobacillus fastidiosus]MBB1062805.1 phosphomevalonate kinase [Limosilactobacillus fastidiosus]MBB1086460.1 phosphomevalonate kinase [Limosilactobacillus fastidiosus]MCD7084782.1 phosphomevalonate kinase [Limosilactobacillus fastidiosus]MCD7085188.1 phosphomevalonate kinase [Limosilactobacillus fastidiosus]MCD7115048.1 phosphomevalonate kinase [Limosilactobacillus fastidiosus]